MIAGGAGGVVGSLGKRGDGAWFQNRRRRGELDFRCHDGGVSGVGGGILDANITPLDGVGIAVENDFRLTDVLHARGCANAKLEQFAQNTLETVLQRELARVREKSGNGGALERQFSRCKRYLMIRKLEIKNLSYGIYTSRCIDDSFSTTSPWFTVFLRARIFQMDDSS